METLIWYAVIVTAKCHDHIGGVRLLGGLGGSHAGAKFWRPQGTSFGPVAPPFVLPLGWRIQKIQKIQKPRRIEAIFAFSHFRSASPSVSHSLSLGPNLGPTFLSKRIQPFILQKVASSKNQSVVFFPCFFSENFDPPLSQPGSP